MANFLELDIQKFADFGTSPDDYVLSYHTAKGLIDSREWILDKETGLYKASYVFSINDVDCLVLTLPLLLIYLLI